MFPPDSPLTSLDCISHFIDTGLSRCLSYETDPALLPRSRFGEICSYKVNPDHPVFRSDFRHPWGNSSRLTKAEPGDGYRIWTSPSEPSAKKSTPLKKTFCSPSSLLNVSEKNFLLIYSIRSTHCVLVRDKPSTLVYWVRRVLQLGWFVCWFRPGKVIPRFGWKRIHLCWIFGKMIWGHSV